MRLDLRVVVLGLSILLAAASPAKAAPANSGAQQPIEIEADRAEITEQTGVSVYSGNVSLRQGDLEMQAERLEIRREGGNGEIHALLTGGPARLRQPGEGGEMVNATAQRIEYRSGDRSINLQGEAQFNRGRDRVSGQNIRYDANARKLQATGPSTGNGRVQIVIQPGQQGNTTQ